MKLALIAAPVAASYSPTVPLPLFGTKSVLPNNATSWGPLSPVMKLALIEAPV